MAVAVAAAYIKYERLPWIQDVFYGVGAAVIAIIAQSAYRLSRKTIGKDLFLWALFAAIAVTTVWTGSEIVWLFVLCGVVAVVVKHPPRAVVKGSVRTTLGFGWISAGLHGAVAGNVVATLTLFFLKAGAFVFGSGLAIVPFLYGGVVSQYHWLTERQFVDAIAVAMITPGPVVITAAFIGYLVAGLIGGTAAAAAVFAPPFLIVIFAAPYYRRFAGNTQVKAFVQGVTAAAVGAIAGAVVILARRSLIDWVTVAISLAVLAAQLKLKKVPEPVLIVVAGMIGLLLHHSGS
jgi:chromate transporter